jgi:lipopolysaccharide biosynthesis protein
LDNKIKPLAFYLPQFHPIKENNEWWGPGFTEWTNVVNAKPLFKGHRQPLVPADLGFYDLRLHQTRIDQAELAKRYGVHGFIYYHYWFGNGRMMLERPLDEVIAMATPDFPFCVCWANHSWTRTWKNEPNSMLLKQEYLGAEDIALHMEYLVKLFKDPRYIKVNGAPLFMMFNTEIPNIEEIVAAYKAEAKKHGFEDLYMVASNVVPDDVPLKQTGFNAKISNAFSKALSEEVRSFSLFRRVARKLKRTRYKNYPDIFDYRKISERIHTRPTDVDTYPMVVPNWDNTPRKENLGYILQHATPDLFKKNLQESIDYLKKSDLSEKFLILKSWNEWAEGNILEPDTVHGHAFLEALKETLDKNA